MLCAHRQTGITVIEPCRESCFACVGSSVAMGHLVNFDVKLMQQHFAVAKRGAIMRFCGAMVNPGSQKALKITENRGVCSRLAFQLALRRE